ncbi:DUF4179 domain-containing protein [Clostridium tetani]|uniref:DUF4179 domain-containing protein n=1 Tax=Clostridium tetani TaxID=1513 RepID=UPI00051327A4|nr:DUF4179 domain-containing protein [Clostridium tetani]KGI44191.1 hypothetical protein KY55_04475 [Clostridium tetani]RXI73063.1 DUF4179 domain-containing protein [Clostridium tetani]RXM58267.1 DUF4179 domain-containing protein [Clostridium tetani]BDR75996.1 hypothetical protein K154306013_16560 [Clostridium tetani]BDR87113.1 hypothetical protein N071400001_17210 [Clostridium tetani]
MNTDNIKIPENLMNNVEKKLRKHVKDKKKKIYKRIIAAVLSLAIILPASAYAYDKYYKDIIFEQEIDLARQNNNITKVNKVFKYKNVEFNFKEIIADETGIEIIYDVSDPRYSIATFSLSLRDAEGNSKEREWKVGYTMPQSNPENNEKMVYINTNGDAINYMKNNPVTLNIHKISYDNSNDKIKLTKNNKYEVDWNLKMKVPIQRVETIPINKEYKTDVGTLKLKSLKKGALKSIILYDINLNPSVKDVMMIQPLFSIRLDKEYTSNLDRAIERDFERSYCNFGNSEEFRSIYYENINEIGIRLVGLRVEYSFFEPKKYKVIEDKLPMEFDFNGENFKIISVEDKKDHKQYTVEYQKENRIYNKFEVSFGGGGRFEYEKVTFKDQAHRDKIYNSLSQRVPNLDSIYNPSIPDVRIGIDTGVVEQKANVQDKNRTEFEIEYATRTFLYDTDEVIIKP